MSKKTWEPGQPVRIGTRGSRLALIQTQYIQDALKALDTSIKIEVVIIKTTGDTRSGPIPESTVGKAWFTAEIEDALLDGSIDVAVHSLKDVPVELPEGLIIMPALQRDDPRDVLAAPRYKTLAKLPPGAVVGTDSGRRKAQILHRRPDVVVRSIRGNVDTRVAKLNDPAQKYDAVVLAAAGLNRLGLAEHITEPFDAHSFVPAMGQGVLAVEICSGNTALGELLTKIQDHATAQTVAAEQAFIVAVGGGCKQPVGCFAHVDGDNLELVGLLALRDGSKLLTQTLVGPATDVAEAAGIGQRLAAQMLQQVDFDILAEE